MILFLARNVNRERAEILFARQGLFFYIRHVVAEGIQRTSGLDNTYAGVAQW